jgi:uncharacterized protein YraI
MNTWKCSILGVSFLALSTGWAAAAPAVVLDYLNLRAGPGYDNYIIAVIPAGWIVGAGGCADGWCEVNVNGILGFVDSNYLGVPAPTYYWSTWAYPDYAYYYGYAPYVGPYAGAYSAFAKGSDADLKAARKLTEHVSPKAVAKNKGTLTPAGTPSGAKLANRSAGRG